MLAMKVTNFGPEIVPNFTLIARFQAKSHIPNPGLVALALALALYCSVLQSITDITEYNRVLQSVIVGTIFIVFRPTVINLC